MARCENHVRLQATASGHAPRFIAFLKVARDHFAPRSIYVAAQMKGLVRVPVCSGGNGVGRGCRLMRFAAQSWELGRYLASQVDTRRCLRRLFQEVTVRFESAQFAQVLGCDFENSLCLWQEQVALDFGASAHGTVF